MGAFCNTEGSRQPLYSERKLRYSTASAPVSIMQKLISECSRISTPCQAQIVPSTQFPKEDSSIIIAE